MNLDIQTIIFLTCLITFTMGAILFVGSRSNPPQIKGVKQWAWSCVMQGVAWLMLSLRGQISDFLSIVLANTILVGVVTMQYQAVRRFKERNSFGFWLYIPTFLTFLIFVYFTYLQPEITIRTTIVCVIILIFNLSGTYLLIFKQKHPIFFGEWLIGGVFLLLGAILAIRIGYIWLVDSEIVYLYTQNKIQSIVFSTICIADILLTFSFTMMLNERFREEILRLAKIDPLTEAYNRAAMEQMFKNELRRATRYKLPVSLLMLDLDNFKNINDTYGHQVGDKTLKKFVGIVNEQLRSTDILARYGGEEFALLLPDSEGLGAEVAAERLREIVEQTLIVADNYKFNITVSVGIADYQFTNDDLDSLLKRADIALYCAKQAGRNRVVVFREENRAQKKVISDRLKLVS